MSFFRFLFHGVAVLCFSAFFICPAPAQDGAAFNVEERILERQDKKAEIKASWPLIGIARIDEESESFACNTIAEFEKDAEELAALMEQERGEDNQGVVPSELNISYELTHPTQPVVSILWTVWSYTGGAHGQLSLVANNYELETGYPVLLEDLFLDPERAILEFTRISRQRLGKEPSQEEDAIPDDMLQAGTEPIESNFQTFILLPDGLRIHFPPYQVAPWSMGPQSVDIKITELDMAKPNMKYWTALAQ